MSKDFRHYRALEKQLGIYTDSETRNRKCMRANPLHALLGVPSTAEVSYDGSETSE